MGASGYNESEHSAGRLTWDHITQAVKAFQRAHGLTVDGMAGPMTQGAMRAVSKPLRTAERYWPLADLPDGRHPRITSGSKWNNRSRPSHMGCDLFYRWQESDGDVPIGDGGAAGRGGKPRWFYPDDAYVRATEAGVVSYSNPKHWTGGLIWITHDVGGIRSGYMHLSEHLVKVGQRVVAGQIIAKPGDNPKARDAKHLHFEISTVDTYAPMAPEPYLADAIHLKAGEADLIDGSE